MTALDQGDVATRLPAQDLERARRFYEEKLGLKPGNSDGTYVQSVPLVGITATNTEPLTITGKAPARGFKWGDDVVAWTKHVAPTAAIKNSELIFAGYGLSGPVRRLFVGRSAPAPGELGTKEVS